MDADGTGSLGPARNQCDMRVSVTRGILPLAPRILGRRSLLPATATEIHTSLGSL
jgi:hypothetical protein